MPLFRFHRRSLHDSLQTTVIVKDIEELKAYILEKFDWCAPDLSTLEIGAYDCDKCFDKRIGWYTQLVKDKDGVIGFLSEPLE